MDHDFSTNWWHCLLALAIVLAPNLSAYWRLNTADPKERPLMVKWNLLIVPIVTVALLGLALALEYVLPPPYNRSSLLLVGFLILAPFLVFTTWMYNRQLAQIKSEESQEKPPQS